MQSLRAAFWPLVFGVLVGLLAGGMILLAGSPPRGQAVELLPPPTAAPLLVHVSGAVANPGVVALPRGSRVQDAIQAAGGLTPDAISDGVNLAAMLQDGDSVRVPRLEEEANPSAGPSTGLPSRSVEIPMGLVNINTATLEELDTLPGIGPVTAQAIIAHRAANGPFANIEAIQDVDGIGPATFEDIQGLITTGN